MMNNFQNRNGFFNLIVIGAIVFVFMQMTATAQTTAFNFQGRLNDGSNPANGRYDLQFILYDALVGGNQVGSIVTKPNAVLINGVFSTQLDFGANAFSGGDRFLEIQLRPNGSSNAYVILGARQQLLSVPYAVRSLNATSANNAQTAISATNATNAANAQTAVNSQQLGGVAASQYIQQGSPGTVKAMIYYKSSAAGGGTIRRCYNSTLNGAAATAPPCGFTVNNFTTGGYGINFGFNTTDLIVSLATGSNQTYTGGEPRNEPTYATYSFATTNSQSINVFTWDDGGSTTGYPDFMILVY